jgi:AcrR family transcriptional regulator
VSDTASPRTQSDKPLLPPPPESPRGADVTAERLLEAAHGLLFERGGAGFSVSEVCGRADANVAMVRYCFGNKDGLLLALTMRITGSFRADFERLAAADLGWREKLERHVAGIVRNYVHFPYINRLLADQLRRADEPGTRALSESFAAPMGAFHRELLAEGRREGAVRDVDPALFFFSVVGMCEFIFSARGWLTYGFGLALDEELVERYVDHVVALVLKGIGDQGYPQEGGGVIIP